MADRMDCGIRRRGFNVGLRANTIRLINSCLVGRFVSVKGYTIIEPACGWSIKTVHATCSRSEGHTDHVASKLMTTWQGAQGDRVLVAIGTLNTTYV